MAKFIHKKSIIVSVTVMPKQGEPIIYRDVPYTTHDIESAEYGIGTPEGTVLYKRADVKYFDIQYQDRAPTV
jgi:hypothetical protein